MFTSRYIRLFATCIIRGLRPRFLHPDVVICLKSSTFVLASSTLYYFDCVAILEDEDTARRLALENEQLAFYCIHEMREVRLD